MSYLVQYNNTSKKPVLQFVLKPNENQVCLVTGVTFNQLDLLKTFFKISFNISSSTIGASHAFHCVVAVEVGRISNYFTEAAALICSLIVSMKRIIWRAKLFSPRTLMSGGIQTGLYLCTGFASH